MLTLAAAETIRGICAGGASKITYTIMGFEVTGGVEDNRVLAQGQLPATNLTLYTCPSATVAFVKSLVLVNATASAESAQLYMSGTAAANVLTQNMSIPANGFAVLEEDGWRVYNSDGELLQKMSTATTAARTDNVTGWAATYSTTTTDADPGTDTIRFDNANLEAVTKVYINLTGPASLDLAPYLAQVTAPNTYKEWRLRVALASDPAKIAIFRVLAVVAATGYYKLTLQPVSMYSVGATTLTFANGSSVDLQLTQVSTEYALPRPGAAAGFRLGFPGLIQLSVGTVSLSANTMYILGGFKFDRPWRLSAFRWNVSSVASACQSRFLIYRGLPQISGGAAPYEKTWDENAQNTTRFLTTTGALGFTVNVNFDPGIYYACLAIGSLTTAPVLRAVGGYIDGVEYRLGSGQLLLTENLKVLGANKSAAPDNPFSGSVAGITADPSTSFAGHSWYPFVMQYNEL